MLKVTTTKSINVGGGVHYFTQFDFISSININQFKEPQAQSLLPDLEQESIFHQSIAQAYRTCPGCPFEQLYRFVHVHYQLLGQIMYTPQQLFQYMHHFISRLFVDRDSDAENLYHSYIYLTGCIPDLFRDLGREYQQFLLNLIDMLALPIVQENPRLFQAGYECLVLSIKYIDPDDLVCVQLMQYIFGRLYRAMRIEYYNLLMEIPAWYVRQGRDIEKLLDQKNATICLVNYQTQTCGNATGAGGTEQHSQNIIYNGHSGDSNEDSEVSDTKSTISDIIDGTIGQYDIYEQFRPKQYLIAADHEYVACGLVAGLPQLALLASRRTDNSFHSQTEDFIRRICRLAQRLSPECNAECTLATTMALMLESRMDTARIVKILECCIQEGFLHTLLPSFLRLLAQQYVHHFQERTDQQRLCALISAHTSGMSGLYTQLMYYVHLHLQAPGTVDAAAELGRLIGMMDALGGLDYQTARTVLDIVGYCCTHRSMQTALPGLQQAVLAALKKLLFGQFRQKPHAIYLLPLVQRGYELGEEDQRLVSDVVADRCVADFVQQQLATLNKDNFYENYDLIRCCRIHNLTMDTRENKYQQMIAVLLQDDQEQLVELLAMEGQAPIKAAVYQKLLGHMQAASLDRTFIDKQVRLLSSADGRIRVNALRLLCKYLDHTKNECCSVLKLLLAIMDPTDVVRIQPAIGSFINALRQGVTDDLVRCAVFHGSLGLLYSKYQYVQEGIVGIFKQLNTFADFRSFIQDNLLYFLQIADAQNDMVDILQFSSLNAKPYRYDIYSQYSASDVKNSVNIATSVLMFFDNCKFKEQLTADLLQKHYTVSMEQKRDDLLELGVEESNFIQVNNYCSIDFDSFVDFFTKMLYSGLIDVFSGIHREDVSASVVGMLQVGVDGESVDRPRLQYILVMTVLLRIQSTDLIALLTQMLLKHKLNKLHSALLLAYHQATNSPFMMVLAQLLNRDQLIPQLLAIDFEESASSENNEKYLFEPLPLTFQTYRDIVYSLTFREKVCRSGPGRQSLFGTHFVLGSEQRASFVAQVNVVLANQLVSYDDVLARQAILSFVEAKYTPSERHQFYNMVCYMLYGVSGAYTDEIHYSTMLDDEQRLQNALLARFGQNQIINLVDVANVLIAYAQSVTIKSALISATITVARLFLVRMSASDGTLGGIAMDPQRAAYFAPRYERLQFKLLAGLLGILGSAFGLPSTEVEGEQDASFNYDLFCAVFNHNNALIVRFFSVFDDIFESHYTGRKKLSLAKLSAFLVRNYEILQQIHQVPTRLKVNALRYFINHQLRPDTAPEAILSAERALHTETIPAQQITANLGRLIEVPALQKITLTILLKCAVAGLDIQRRTIRLLHSDDTQVQEMAVQYLSTVRFPQLLECLEDMDDFGGGFHALFGNLRGENPVYASMFLLTDDNEKSILEALQDPGLDVARYTVCAQIMSLFYRPPSESVFREASAVIARLVRQPGIPTVEAVVKRLISQFGRHKYNSLVQGYTLTILDGYGEALAAEHCPSADAVSEAEAARLGESIAYFDVAVYHVLLSPATGRRSHSLDLTSVARGKLCELLHSTYTKTPLGRLLLFGVLGGGFTDGVVTVLLQQGESAGGRVRHSAATQLIRFIGQYCSVRTYFALYDQLLASRTTVHLANVLLDTYRFCRSPRASGTGPEEEILARAFNDYDPPTVAQLFYSQHLRRHYQFLVAGRADSPGQRTGSLYQVLHGAAEFDAQNVNAVAKALKRLNQQLDLKILTQKLIRKLSDKVYSQRRKARETLAGVCCNLGMSTLDSVIFNIRGLFEGNSTFNQICSSSMECIVREFIEFPYERITQVINCHTSACGSLAEAVRDHQMVGVAQNPNTAIVRCPVVVNDVLANRHVQLLAQVVQADLFGRSRQDERLMKIFAEYDDAKAFDIIELVCAQYKLPDKPFESQDLLLSFLIPMLSQSVDYKVDTIRVADSIILGLSKNVTFDHHAMNALIRYFNDDRHCFYCKLKPPTVQSIRDIKNEILHDSTLTEDQRTVKMRHAHQLLEKEPERVYGITTRAISNQNYNVNFCAYMAVRLIQRALEQPFGGGAVGRNAEVQSALRGYLAVKGAQPTEIQSDIDWNTPQQPEFDRGSVERYKLLDILVLALFSNSVDVLVPLFQVVHILLRQGLRFDKDFLQQTLTQLHKTDSADLIIAISQCIIYVLQNDPQQIDLELQGRLIKICSLLVKGQTTNKICQPYEVVSIITTQLRLQNSVVYDINDFFINHSVQLAQNKPEIQMHIQSSVVGYLQQYKMTDRQRQDKIKSLIKLSVESHIVEAKVLSLQCLAQLFPKLDQCLVENLEGQIVLSLLAADINGRDNKDVVRNVVTCYQRLKDNPLLCTHNLIFKHLQRLFIQESDLSLQSQVLDFVADMLSSRTADAIQFDEKYHGQIAANLEHYTQHADQYGAQVAVYMQYMAASGNPRYGLSAFIMHHQEVAANTMVFAKIAWYIEDCINRGDEEVVLERFTQELKEDVIQHAIWQLVNKDIAVIADSSHFYAQILQHSETHHISAFMQEFLSYCTQYCKQDNDICSAFGVIFDEFISGASVPQMQEYLNNLVSLQKYRLENDVQVTESVQFVAQMLVNRSQKQVVSKRPEIQYKQLHLRAIQWSDDAARVQGKQLGD